MNSSPERIYQTALSSLGTDASPADLAPDELGCAETVSNILFDAGCVIPITVSTVQLGHFLETNKSWSKVSLSGPGDVIICITGEGGENGITHGHTGIIMKNDNIASNNSATGTFIENYTLTTWKARWEDLGGYPIHFYRLNTPLEAPKQAPAAEISPETEKVVSEGLEVVKQASRFPSLKPAAMTLLKGLGEFLVNLIT